tara:strand:+ start:208 stop:804 length:597 start_codon:yes stop_codon:yes gene_type:complete
MKSFIYTRPEALTPDLCNSLITQYEQHKDTLAAPAVFESDDGKKHNTAVCDSVDIGIWPYLLEDPSWNPILTEVYDIIDREERNYRHTYRGMKAVGKLRRVDNSVLIKYEPGGAHHAWHCERGSYVNSDRVLTWMIYLNDVTDEGGTAFYYQDHVESAQQGKLVMWSSEWMHLHKGVISPTQEKYIMTGWFEFDTDND